MEPPGEKGQENRGKKIGKISIVLVWCAVLPFYLICKSSLLD
ncbi:hypothetical protein SLEP1_g31183 [Rubroshorea leprosula]|nr:hypothetical protein SLEP1_g31183 [Rubroshorea leprosula]